MPLRPVDHVEHAITGGHIHIATESGAALPAYWSHPDTGGVFPGIVLLHDWWGLTGVERRLAARFAQAGYYVIAPDLFDGETADTPQGAMRLVESLGEQGYARADTALQALEAHHRCNRRVAAVGLGMGGSLAFEAAIERPDLEAAVAYYGFPQRYLRRLAHARTPILAIYGEAEPHVSPQTREQLRRALAESPLDHELVMLEGASRDFFAETNLEQRATQTAWETTLVFLDRHLERPKPTHETM